ncbi:MAG: alkaline phosphatase [Myxococcota bacterium]
MPGRSIHHSPWRCRAIITLPTGAFMFTVDRFAPLACLVFLVANYSPPAHASEAAREDNAWFAAGRASVREASRFIVDQPTAKNVILFVGDGMGISTVTAARILEGQRRGESGEENRLAFEGLPHVAFSKTYNTDAQVSDSASTMTAIVSGVKTQTGVLGVDERVQRGDHESVESSKVLSILEEAEDRGLSTGVVSTATLTHATPAGCYAHVPFRLWENDSQMSKEARKADFPDIARQLVEFKHGDGLEDALGGGREHFRPRGERDPERWRDQGKRTDGRDLILEWLKARKGARYVWNREQFLAVDRETTSRLLGLFEPGHMQFEADRSEDAGGEPSLAEMTELAIDLLAKNPKGYFLMIEAGRIDHGHHAGIAAHALSDTIALSDAVRTALTKTSAEDTLIVVTADHSHTLTISGYPKRGNPILGKVTGFKWSSEGIGSNEVSLDQNRKPYTTLSYANGPGRRTAKDRPDLSLVDTERPDYRQESTVPLSSETHAGEDVPIYAGGPRAALFHGVQEQNYIYHAMVEAFGWTHAGTPTKAIDSPTGF